MGLPAAFRAHQKGDLKLACKHYKRALDQKDHQPALFQNYGAILREQGAVDKAEKIYIKGLKLHPSHRGIRLNYANLIRNIRPFESFSIHFSLLREKINQDPEDVSASEITPVVEILEELGYLSWAYQICRWSFLVVAPTPSLLILLFKLVTNDNIKPSLSAEDLQVILQNLNANLSSLDPVSQSEYFFALVSLQLRRREFSQSLNTLTHARQLLSNADIQSADQRDKVLKINNQNSWNTGCILLSHQYFVDGWKLFEFGLRTKAAGPQKWQRAMPKPFTNDQCTVWRGENLVDKSILLLEEQAIGDVMQFMTLVPDLLKEARHIGLLINDRLFAVYQRSFDHFIKNNSISVWSFSDFQKGLLKPVDYDYQSPMGSVCQYRFSDIRLFGRNSPILKADPLATKELVQKYQRASSKDSHLKLIGVSWRGGGRADRIKQKSIDINLFSQLMRDMPGIRFVSLQYGESQSVIEYWRSQGIDILHDGDVNPLRDMDHWHSQVAACDAVISVANTTIHGAGGLNIPTYCLLSRDSIGVGFNLKGVS